MQSFIAARGSSSSAAKALAWISSGLDVAPATVSKLSTSSAPAWPHQTWPSSWASVKRWRTGAWTPFVHSTAPPAAPKQAPATPGPSAATTTCRPAACSTVLSRQRSGACASSPSAARASRARLAPRFESIPAMHATSATASRRLRRRRLLQPEVADRRLAHLVFLDLAGDRHRELVDHPHIARHLVVRQAPGAELAHRVGVERRGALAHAHPRAQLLAVARIGNADDLH